MTKLGIFGNISSTCKKSHVVQILTQSFGLEVQTAMQQHRRRHQHYPNHHHHRQQQLSQLPRIFLVSLCVIGVAVTMDVTTVAPEATTEDTSGRLLSLPVAEKCAKRPVHFTHDGHNYFYSGNETEFKDMKLNWLDARNICREYCMDLVSLESPSEDQMVNEYINKSDLAYIWTSGRLCNFKGCDREDLQPTRINGWFWSGSGVKMAPTDKAPPGWSYQPWSFTGHNSKINGSVLIPQPDNAEFDINQSVEACMGILNNVYDDGIKWHDIACYHTKPFICEDSEQLLDYARASFPETNIF